MAKSSGAKTNALAVAGMVLPLLIKLVDERFIKPKPKVDVPVDAPDTIEQLRELGKLRESGVITHAEFDALKEQLLGHVRRPPTSRPRT